MGLGEFFGKINEKMNAGFDSIIAFLDEKGIPAQKYADFLEEKGIPAMWFTLLIIALIIAVIVLLVTVVFASSVTLNLSIMTDDGTTPSSVFLNITGLDGEIFLSEQVQNGTQVKIKGIGVGDSLFLNSSLEGYSFTSPSELPISEKEMLVSLIFEKQEKTGKVSFKVINGEEQTTVGSAKLSIYDDDELLVEGTTDEYGGFDAVLPLKKVNLTIDRDGYEQYTKSVELLENKDYIFELSPKEFDSSEEGSFKFVVKDMTQNALNNVKIDVYNIKTNAKLGSTNTNEDGIGVFSAKKGTSIRFVAQKDGFAVFDSNAEGISRTLLTDEEVISFMMPIGGGKLSVIVVDSLGVGIQEAKVSLYTTMLIEQLTQNTDIGGTTDFSGLDYTILKYISVYREGYYPQTRLLDSTSEMKFEMEKVDLSKAAIVDVFVIDKDNKPVGSATLEFKYDVNGELYPIAHPNPITSVTGYFTFNLKPDITLTVSANTDDKYGEASLLLKAGRNRIDVKMENTGSKFTMYLYDKYGKPLANAHVMLFDKQGNLVYDGYTDAMGRIEADALGNKELDMFVTDENGNTYSQTINPKDKMQIKLDDNKNKDKLFVSLSKVTDLEGKEVSAMQKGKTYLLVFNLFWPEGLYSGGLHIRLGSDSEKYVANQDVGIIGFDGVADNFKYGISYSPLPLPGDYSVDYYSTGVAGQFNKWLELYFTNPSGNSNLKVRVKSKATTDLNSMEIRYRAWTQDTNDGFTRNPVDSMLGTKENITTKYSLYADTYLKELQLMDGSLNCENDVCVSYTILDDQFTYDIAKFNGVLDYYYALDLELTSIIEQQVSLSVQTEDDPKLYLNNYSENITEFSPKDEKNTKQNVPVDMSSMEKKKVRFYFNPFKEGLTNIVVKTITTKGVIEKNIPVNIFPKKEMEVILNADFIPLGEDFPIIVKEKGGNYLTNAKITILNKKTNKNAMFVEGTGKVDFGKDGRYLIKNTLASGFYLVSVSVPGYLPTELEILVGNVGALFVKSDNELVIPKNTKQGTVKIAVQNKTKMPVESMSVNIVSSSLSPNFGISAKMVTGFIAANGTSELMVMGSYNGEEERENGVVELEIVGVQNKNEITKIKTKVFVYYNKEIKNTSCLWASKEALIYSLPAVQNSKIEDSILFRNNCEFDLKVTPQMISDDLSNYGLQLNLQGFDLKKGEEKSIKFTLVNLTPIAMADETKVLSLYLVTDYFTKNIPMNVTIWNAASSLSIITAGHVFISAFKEMQGQYVPVIVQNNGRLPIYNIQVMASNNRYQMQSYNYGANNYGSNFLNSYSQLNNNRYNQQGYNSQVNNYGVDAYTYNPLSNG
ncbi:MAG: carboxypeptidase-like regulatory domain-containing protein, partial [Candidatus ainarchaeum sp.]|nr:carboxypeptidase-like regulatory domain-containing protein [Candidatus ainarchaeum sp.]